MYVVDTRNVSMCQGWIAIEAARSARDGKSLEAIIEQIDGLIPRRAHAPDRRYAQIPVYGRAHRPRQPPDGQPASPQAVDFYGGG